MIHEIRETNAQLHDYKRTSGELRVVRQFQHAAMGMPPVDLGWTRWLLDSHALWLKRELVDRGGEHRGPLGKYLDGTPPQTDNPPCPTCSFRLEPGSSTPTRITAYSNGEVLQRPEEGPGDRGPCETPSILFQGVPGPSQTSRSTD